MSAHDELDPGAVAHILAAEPAAPNMADETSEWSIADRIENVRLDLFGSTAIVDVARRATSPDDDWHLNHVLAVVVGRIDAACAKLELLAGDAREREQKHAAAAPASSTAPVMPAADSELAAEIGRALVATDKADSVVSTVAAAIAGGDADDGDVVYLLQDVAWPLFEEARKAIEQIRWRLGAERKDGAA